ncbi:MAG TPA: acetolactate synthase small subunit [Thermoplasmata archaeon]|nr:acetolactate synthase small subunit [Thermoplasmata archaeon]
MQMHVISALVENRSGVLTRMSGMLTRRDINIQSLTVSSCEKMGLSRMTITIMSNKEELEQAEKQLNKLVEVVKISTLHKSSSIIRDLCLVRVNAKDTKIRGEIIQIVDAYRGKIVDISLNTMTIEITDDPRRIDKLIEMLRAYGIKKLLRTGVTAISMNGANGE